MLGFKAAVLRAKHNMPRVYFHLGLVIAFAGVSFAGTTACVAPKALQTRIQTHPTAEAYAELGNWFSEKQQYDCAGEAFTAGLKHAPRSAELFYMLGLNFIRKGDFAEATKPLQQSINLKADVLKPHLLLATALEETHQPAEAQKEWLAAIKIDPHSEMGLAGASKNLLAAGDYAGVVALLGSESSISDDLAVDLASAYQRIGAPDEAIGVLRKALQNSPSSVSVARALATVLVVQRRFGEASQVAKEMVQRHPEDRDAQKLYLHVLVSNEDNQLALPLAHKLLQSDPHDFLVLYLNGLLDNRSGDYADARPLLEEAARLNPNHYNCHYHLGITLSQLGDLRAAKEQFEQALALGASEPQVRFEYAKVLRSLGESEQAGEQLALYQKQQKASQQSTLAANKSGQADQELAQGHVEKAIALYREAVAAVPDNAKLRFKLSVALDKLGDRTGEMDALKKAVQLDPTMAVAHYQLGYLASLQGDFVLAEEQYRAAAQAAPQYVEAWIGLAATLATESRFPEAQQAVESALHIDPKNTNALELQKELASAVQSNP